MGGATTTPSSKPDIRNAIRIFMMRIIVSHSILRTAAGHLERARQRLGLDRT